jgi:hypothetical protein
MLFRIAFYLCQLGLLGSAVALVGLCLSFVAGDVAVWLWGPGLGLAVVSWLAWSLLTAVQNTGGRLWCPLCGTRCPMEPESLFGLRPTLGCPKCGIVRGSIFSLPPFKLEIDCPDDPTQNWQRQPGLLLRFDFDHNTLNGVALGEPLARLSALGPVEDKTELRSERYSYPSLGIAVHGIPLTIDGFELTWAAFARPSDRPFAGSCVFRGREVHLSPGTTEAQFIELFGPPTRREGWGGQEGDGLVELDYVIGDASWHVSFSEDGTLYEILVSRERSPTLAGFVVANEREAPRIAGLVSGAAGHEQGAPSAGLGGLDNLVFELEQELFLDVQLAVLQGILLGEGVPHPAWAEQMVIFRGSEQSPRVFRLSNELVSRLAGLGKREIPALAQRWADMISGGENAERFSSWSAEDRRVACSHFIRDLAEVAARAVASGHPVLMWQRRSDRQAVPSVLPK